MGNTCRQPVIRGGRAAAEDGPPGRDIGACVGPDLHAPTLSSSDPPAATQGGLASAAEGHRGVPRAGAGAGAPGVRKAEEEGGREARDRKRDASGRGASPAKPRGRVRLEDAPRRSGGARRGEEERDRGKERRRPARAPGAASLPRRGGRPHPFPDDTRSKTQRREPHTPLQATPARTTSLSGSTRTGRRRRRRRRRPRRPRSPARGPSASVTRPHKRSRELSSLPHVDPSRPTRGGTPPGRTRPSPLDDARPSPSVPHRATARGTGGGAAGGGGSADEGGSRAGAEERGGRDQKGPEGRGDGQENEGRRARGAAAARPPPTTTPTRVWTWGDGGPAQGCAWGPANRLPAARHPSRGEGGGD